MEKKKEKKKEQNIDRMVVTFVFWEQKDWMMILKKKTKNLEQALEEVVVVVENEVREVEGEVEV
jgi:hypothetical protein